MSQYSLESPTKSFNAEHRVATMASRSSDSTEAQTKSKPRSQAQWELESMEKAIIDIEATINQLTDDLKPTLRSESPSVNPEEQYILNADSSPLTKTLYVYNKMLGQIKLRLTALRDRLDLY